MLNRSHRALALLLALVLLTLAPGCNRGDSSSKSQAPTKTDRTRKMEFRATATGALAFKASGTYDVRILTLLSDDAKAATTTLLSVGPNIAVPLEDGRAMRVAFDLMRYKGDGSYQIHAGAPRDLADKAKQGVDPTKLDQSNVLVQIWAQGVDPKAQYPQTFDRALEPCPVTVKDDGDSGHLHCPRMEAPDGGEFVLDMRWSLP